MGVAMPSLHLVEKLLDVDERLLQGPYSSPTFGQACQTPFGGRFTSPYPLRPDPGASRAALLIAISLCLSRKRLSLEPEGAQNVNPKGFRA